MRIGFDAKRAFHNRAGLGNYARNLLTNLYRYFPEHRYLLYTPNRTDLFQPEIEGYHYDIREPKGVLSGSFWRSLGIPAVSRRDDLHIYHGLSHELPLLPFPASIRTVLSFHDLIFERYPALFPAIDRSFYRLKYRTSARRADHLIAISEQTSTDLQEFYGLNKADISIIHPIIHPIYFQQMSDNDMKQIVNRLNLPDQFILNVGTLNKRKNQAFLIDAFERSNISSEVHLIIAGATADAYSELGEKISNSKQALRIHLMTELTDLELSVLYRRAMAMIYTSIFEGFGMPIIEAAAQNCPVICAGESCFQEFEKIGVRFYEAGKLEDLVLQLDRLPTDLPQIHKNALEKYRAENLTNDLINLYQRLL